MDESVLASQTDEGTEVVQDPQVLLGEAVAADGLELPLEGARQVRQAVALHEGEGLVNFGVELRARVRLGQALARGVDWLEGLH